MHAKMLSSSSSSSSKRWWRRVAYAVKDRRSLCFSAAACVPRGRSLPWRADLEAAVIRATSHDDRSIDYRSAEQIFRWAGGAPALAESIMSFLARRAGRTRCWAVALKALLLAHGILLSPPSSSPYLTGRLPFDLTDFRDRSPTAWGFSEFVRAYFRFLDRRTLLINENSELTNDELLKIERLQTLLDLLLQIQPYADGMAVGLVVEAMDCAIIEVCDVYSAICAAVAKFLIVIAGGVEGGGGVERKKRSVGVLRRAAEQNARLAAYFEICRELGVLNAAELPPVDSIPEEDINDLERLVLGGASESISRNLRRISYASTGAEREESNSGLIEGAEPEENAGLKWEKIGTVVTENWVVFQEESEEHFGNEREYLENNPFVDCPGTLMSEAHYGNNNLIELI